MTMKLQDETTLDLTKFEMQKILGIAFCEAEADLTEASWVVFGQTDTNQPVKVSFMRLEDKGGAQSRIATVSVALQTVRELREAIAAAEEQVKESEFVETLLGHVDDAHEALRKAALALRELDAVSQRTSKLRTDVTLTLENIVEQVRDLSCYVEKFEIE